MDYVRSIRGHYGEDVPKPGNLEGLCQYSDSQASGARLPDSRFEDISRMLENTLQGKEWTARPRTYFILWNIRRIDAMEAFIAQGLNDTSLPYKGKRSLPAILNPIEKDDFLRRQDLVLSDVLQLEKGKHVRIADGDVLFESHRKKLGVGSQGTTVVDKVISKATSKVYARKCINRKSMFGHDSKALKIYENELKTLHKVADHSHLIKVRGTYTDKKHLVMLLEPVADENLKDYMNRGPLHSIEAIALFRTYFGCLAHTIRFLHDTSIEILHKDIKPENILLKNGRLYLNDFGTAFDWSKTGQSMTQSNVYDVRTPRYQSPEAAIGEFHRSSDIWSLGVVFLEMVTILRGKRLADMDNFLQSHGQRVVHIHNNLEAATNWFEQLRECQDGSPIDNEPMTWIKSMLNRVDSNRPTAAALFDMIVDFQDARFCGPCCSGDDSDSSGESEANTEILSDIAESEALGERISGSGQVDRKPIPGGWPDLDDAHTPQAQVNRETLDPSKGLGPLSPPPKASISPVNNGHGVFAETGRLLRTFDERPRSILTASGDSSSKISQVGAVSKVSSMATKRSSPVKPKAKNFQERDSFIKWLTTVPAKFAPTPSQHRTKLVKPHSSQPSRTSSIENQHIKHFLSSLPEEAAEYEEAHQEYDDLVEAVPLFKGSKRSRTMPISSPKGNTMVTRSNSQEDLKSSSHQLDEDTDKDQFADINRSRLIHYASDGDLNLALVISAEALQEVKKDLVEFATSNFQLPGGIASKTCKPSISESHLRAADALPVRPLINAMRSGRFDYEELIKLNAAPTLSNHGAESPPTGAEKRNPQGGTKTRSRAGAIPTTEKKSSKASTLSKAPRLGAFVKKTRPKRPEWESATVIMGRILDNKVSEAPTSIMSLNTRAKVSGGRPVLRWNDRYYGYLQSFVADGRVGAVRDLLDAGCNPGTEEKPRWAPVYNAVRGASDKHLKCLRALGEHGANMNAVRSTNGRTFLHYAIEQKLWPGYSSVVYTLLANGANPNIRDDANDLPILMLLVGNGPLPQEKRDALFLLLAPSFDTNLDVSISGTLDNPLHLAIRRKDAYTVDAILAKLQEVQKGGPPLHLINSQNASGFTPLLLAFTIFTMKQESDEELRIINLLLDNGAKPDDRDATQGKTPLHLVIGISKNSIALELLCRRSASPKIRDSSGQTASDLVRSLQLHYPEDTWYTFAAKRMLNTLQEDDWRPPELMNFFFEE